MEFYLKFHLKTKKEVFFFFEDMLLFTQYLNHQQGQKLGLVYSYDDSRLLSLQKCNYFCFGFERNGIKMYRKTKTSVPQPLKNVKRLLEN
jgi:hypothetical protein